MKYFSIILTMLLLVVACEESESMIITNPDATATFEECIPSSFSMSSSIRIDTTVVEKIQEALRLARTVDIELQDFVGSSGCGPRYDFQIFFSDTLDSVLMSDLCRTGFQLVDSLLDEYGFQHCEIEYETFWIEDTFGYVFNTNEYLNLRELALQMQDIEGVVEAGIPQIDCLVYQCKGFSFSVLDDVFTFRFQDWCQGDEVIEWIVVVANDEAFLVSKN